MYSGLSRADQARLFHNVPDEMKALRQWVLWRYEEPDEAGKKPTKVPYSPITSFKASVANPHTWASFLDTVFAFEQGEWSGVGLVLTKSDPYAIIDLDDTSGLPDHAKLFARQQRLYEMSKGYAERPPSGTGLHIITIGSLPGGGRKRDQIEIYDDVRFMTMTGDVYRDAPIVDESELVRNLWADLEGKLKRVARPFEDRPQREDDRAIVERARGALNGEKFFELHSGRWEALYPSQNEADWAYINMLAFYTQNREQIRRMFRASALGQRKKALRVQYVETMVERSFDRQLPPINTDAIRAQLAEAIAAKVVREGHDA